MDINSKRQDKTYIGEFEIEVLSLIYKVDYICPSNTYKSHVYDVTINATQQTLQKLRV